MDHASLKNHEMLSLKLILLLRRDFKYLDAIAFISFYLKLYGIFLISNCLLIDYRNLEVSNILKILTLFGSELNEDKFFIKYYNFIFFLLLSFMTVYIGSVLWYLKNSDNSIFIQKEKKNKLFKKKWQRPLEKFISYSTIIIIFLSQHLIEFLSLAVVSNQNIQIPENSTNSDSLIISMQAKIISFKNSLVINNSALLVISIIQIILINAVLFFNYSYLNQHSLNSNSLLKYSKGGLVSFMFTLFSNLQGILLYDVTLFKNSHTAFHIILTCILLLFCISYLIKQYPSLCHFNMINISLIFSLIYSVITCVVNIIFKYTENNRELTLNIWTILLKVVNELFITVFLTDYIIKKRKIRYYNYFAKHLFKVNKKFSYGNIYFLCDLLKRSIYNLDDLKILINIFNQHSIDCKNEECYCKVMNMNELYMTINDLEKENRNVVLKKKPRIKIFYNKFKELISFIECIIVNSISKITTDDISDDYSILLHADFVSYFKKSYLHSNYLIAVYSDLLKLKLSFNDRVNFFILKNNNYKQYYKQVLQENVFGKFYKQFNAINKIKTLILDNCHIFHVIIKIRQNYKKSEVFNQSDAILKMAERFLKNENKLIEKIIKNPKCLENSEFSYIIYNYFNQSIQSEIPQKLKNLSEYKKFTIINMDGLINKKYSYSEMKMMHPVIVKFEGKENFIIKYACPEFCEKTNYKREDLIGQDINILIPKFMEKNHKIILKKTIFIDRLYEIKKKTFVLTYDNYYVPTDIDCAFSTNFNGEIKLILNLKIKEIKDTKLNKYFFLIDRNFNIISHSKNFDDNYFISHSIIKRLDMNIIDMLSLNYDKINQRFNTKINLISSNNMHNAENIVSVMQGVDFSEMNTKIINHAHDRLYMKIHKSKFLPSIEKVKSCLEEYDSDKKYQIKKLNKLIQDFRLMEVFKDPSSKNPSFWKEYSKRLGCVEDYLEETNYFLFELQLKHIGDLHFYYGKLYEKKIDTYPNNLNQIQSKTNYIEKYTFDPVYQLKENILNDLHEVQPTELINIQPSIFKSTIEMGNINVTVDNLDSKNSNSSIYSSTANLITNAVTSKGKSNLYKKTPLINTSSLMDDRVPKINFFKRLNEKYIFSILLTLLTIHVGFFIYVYGYSHKIMTESENVFFVNFYSILLKSVIYYSSSVTLSSCILADLNKNNKVIDGFTLNYQDIRFKINIRALELLDFQRDMKSFLDTIETGADEINNYLFNVEEYFLIYEDWRLYSRLSDFDSEIVYYRNYIYQLIDPPALETCRLSIFFDGKFYSDSMVEKEEFTLYYIFKNVYTKLRIALESISNKSTEVLLKYQNRIRTYFSFTNFLLLLFSVLMLIFMFLDLKILEANIISSIENILNFDIEKLNKIDTKLDNFITVVEYFNKQNIKKFESTIANLKIGKNSFNPPVKNETIQTKVENEQIEIESNIQNIKLARISYILLIFGFLVYLFISVFQLVLREKQLNNIIYANKISVNILDRFSDVAELDLYYKISVILNDPYNVAVSQEDYDSLSELDIYEKFSENSDELFSIAKESYFAMIFYKISQVNKNIDYFMENYKNEDVLQYTREHEELLYDKDFCKTMTIYFLENYYTCISEEECSSLSESSIKECDIYLNKDGFKLGYLAILSNLKNRFMDFLKMNRDQRNVDTFIYNKEILIATQNIEGIYKKIHSNVMYSVKKDMTHIYDKLRNTESLFTFIQISFDFGFLIFVFIIVLMKMKKQSRTLEKFYEKIDKNFGAVKV